LFALGFGVLGAVGQMRTPSVTCGTDLLVQAFGLDLETDDLAARTP
jgi:hypothetical protein